MSKTENYKITFIGATPNQAQAIEGVIQAISQLKSKDELPMKKYETELKPMYTDYLLFKEIKEFADMMKAENLSEKVGERMKLLDEEISKRETAIKKRQENIDYINNYIKEIRSHIKEEVDTTKKTVVYTYDTAYIKPFLDLAVIVFEIGFEEKKTDTKAS